MMLKKEIEKYKPAQTMNIADLGEIALTNEIETSPIKENSDGEKYVYKYIVVDGVEYRIPGVVLGDMKSILEKLPDTMSFIVTKKGTGKATRYTVMPGK